MADHPFPHSPEVALICCAVGAIQELAHDRGDFCEFSSFDKLCVFGLEFWIVAGGDEGWHVEGFPYGLPGRRG